MILYTIGMVLTLVQVMLLGLHKKDEHPMWAIILVILTWPALLLSIAYMFSYRLVKGKMPGNASVAIPYTIGLLLISLFFWL